MTDKDIYSPDHDMYITKYLQGIIPLPKLLLMKKGSSCIYRVPKGFGDNAARAVSSASYKTRFSKCKSKQYFAFSRDGKGEVDELIEVTILRQGASRSE